MYRITVNKIGKESRATKQWRKLTDKEVEQQYGYVEGEEEVDVEEKIYEQLVEDIDMQKIVKVVNSRKLAKVERGDFNNPDKVNKEETPEQPEEIDQTKGCDCDFCRGYRWSHEKEEDAPEKGIEKVYVDPIETDFTKEDISIPVEYKTREEVEKSLEDTPEEWEERWEKFKDKAIVGYKIDEEDEYQEEYNTYLSEFDTTGIESFISQELDKAREEGRREILEYIKELSKLKNK